MKAYEISPNSFCKGVLRAIKIIKNSINENTPKPIYMLGYLVHNKFVVNSFENINIITSNYYEELLKINEGTIIITAHGASPNIYKIINEKNLNLIDTTCVNVKRIHNSINAYLDNNYEVYVIGNEQHPEVKGYLGISNNVHIYNGIINSQKAFVTTQTTLVRSEVCSVLKDIQNKYPNCICNNDVCNATTNRQNAVLESINNYDLFIIIGDPLSNNCSSLYDLVIKNNKDAIKINNVEDLNNYSITKYEKIGVTAAASTPKAILLEVVDCINNNKPFKSKLTNQDYIN